MTARKAYVDLADGRQVHYRHLPGPGIPLVLLHRTPASSVTFEPMMETMSGERPLYAFDTPGFGNSFDVPGQPTVIDYRDWLMEAIDCVGIEQFHIFGHHTGTHLATEIAAAWPERVRSLGLNGAAYFSADERRAFADMVGAAARPDEKGDYLMQTWQLISSLFPHFDADLVHREFCGALRAMDGRDQAFGAIWDQDYVEVISRVRCPVLAVSADDDFFADYLDRIRANVPGSRTEILGTAKVASPELDTQRSCQTLRDFMAEVEGAGTLHTSAERADQSPSSISPS